MWSESEKSLLEAVSIAPDFSAAYLRLGILNMDRGRYESAELLLKTGLEIEETAAMYTLLGVAQRHLGQRSAAMDSLRNAVKIDPVYEEGYYNLGVMLSSDRPREAREMLEMSLKLDPQYQSAHRELGWVLRQLELYDEAECHLRSAIALDESDGWAYIYLGNLQWVRKDIYAAEQSFKMAVHDGLKRASRTGVSRCFISTTTEQKKPGFSTMRRCGLTATTRKLTSVLGCF
jgi:tetratricopeptide (TPR) repeat protein